MSKEGPTRKVTFAPLETAPQSALTSVSIGGTSAVPRGNEDAVAQNSVGKNRRARKRQKRSTSSTSSVAQNNEDVVAQNNEDVVRRARKRQKWSTSSTSAVAQNNEDVAQNNEDPGPTREAKHYCNIKLASTSIRTLAPKWKEYVENSCFGQFSNMLKDEESGLDNSIAELFENFDPSTEQLEVQSGVYLNLRTATPSLLHLPSGPFEFKHDLFRRHKKDTNKHLDFVKKKYGFDLTQYTKKNGTISKLWNAITTGDMSEPQFWIQYTLALTSSVLAPKSSQRVNLDILGDIVPFERIRTLNWAGFVVDKLVSGACHGKGCLYLLHMAKKMYEQVNDKPPRDSPSQMVDNTNGGAFSGSTAVYDESLNSSVKNELHLLKEELEHRYNCFQLLMDKKFLGLDDQSDVEITHVRKNEEQDGAHDQDEEDYELEDQLSLDDDQGTKVDQGHGADQGDDSYPISDLHGVFHSSKLQGTEVDQGDGADQELEDQLPLDGDQGTKVDQGQGVDQAPLGKRIIKPKTHPDFLGVDHHLYPKSTPRGKKKSAKGNGKGKPRGTKP